MALTKPLRTFVTEVAVRESIPLVVGITGFSGAGKTRSALEIATGIQRAYGGDLFGIDADNGRMKTYAPGRGEEPSPGQFKMQRVALPPPHGADDFLAAIEHCVREGAKVIVADPFSYEHDGEGGMLEQYDAYLDAKCGGDWDKRARMSQVAWGAVKKPRNRLNRRIKQLAGEGIAFVFTYQAKEKMKLEKGKEPESKGWQPVTTSDLIYDMTLRVLLRPGADGVPEVKGDTPAEKLLIKNNQSFAGWFKASQPLSVELGERLGRWAKGGGVGTTLGAATAQPTAAKDQASAPNGRPQSQTPNGSSHGGGVPAADGTLLFNKNYPRLGGTAIEHAKAEDVAAYLNSLQAVLDDETKSKAHAGVQKHKDSVEELYQQILAEEAMAAETGHGSENAA